jgi:hypothetical protein
MRMGAGSRRLVAGLHQTLHHAEPALKRKEIKIDSLPFLEGGLALLDKAFFKAPSGKRRRKMKIKTLFASFLVVSIALACANQSHAHSADTMLADLYCCFNSAEFLRVAL